MRARREDWEPTRGVPMSSRIRGAVSLLTTSHRESVARARCSSQPASTGSRRSKRERARSAWAARSPDVYETENPTRDTTHRGARLTAPWPLCRKRPFATHTDRLRPNPPIPVAVVFGRQTAHHGQHWGIPHGQPSTGLLTGQGEHGLSHPTLEAVVVHELLEQFGIILD